MRFTENETEWAIRVIRTVQDNSGAPLPPPAALRETAARAERGDEEARAALTAAKLRLLYPLIPSAPYRTEREKLWQSIIEGRYEGIRLVEKLDYERAWTDLQGEGPRPRLGSYFERWLSARIKQELVAVLTEGWRF